MIVRIGDYEFDRVDYDADGDVLYLTAGEPLPTQITDASPEGHAVSVDEHGKVIGLTIVGAKWILEREGKITITVPDTITSPAVIEARAEDLAPVLQQPADAA